VVHASKALEIAARERIPLRGARPREIRFVCDDVPDWPRIEKDLRAAGATIFETAEATLVGPGIGVDPALVARAEAIAAEVCGASPMQAMQATQERQEIDLRATPQSVTIAIRGDRLQLLEQALHDALVLR
jgi:hypothetical protein